MRIISEFDPFGPYNQYLKITHRFKGLPNYVVSDGQLIQLEHFVKKRTRPLKVIEEKTNQRLLYFYIDSRKVSRIELKSRIYKCKDKIQVWS